MIAYLGRRLIQSVLILLGVSLITFALLYLLPADPVRQIAGRSATPETVENIRRQLGLDQPFVIQYWRYLTSLVSGDLGRSYIQRSRGHRADRLAAAGQPAADGRRHPVRGDHRAEHGLDRGRQARQRHRPVADGRLLHRRLGAAIRRRPAAALRVCRQARLVPDRRLRHLAASGAAVADARRARRRLVRAHDALVDDRRAAPGLYPHRPRQGPCRAAPSCSVTRCPTPSCRSSP